jgi:hypothetical protein
MEFRVSRMELVRGTVYRRIKKIFLYPVPTVPPVPVATCNVYRYGFSGTEVIHATPVPPRTFLNIGFGVV